MSFPAQKSDDSDSRELIKQSSDSIGFRPSIVKSRDSSVLLDALATTANSEIG